MSTVYCHVITLELSGFFESVPTLNSLSMTINGHSKIKKRLV